jgi:hypothetical protein
MLKRKRANKSVEPLKSPIKEYIKWTWKIKSEYF